MVWSLCLGRWRHPLDGRQLVEILSNHEDGVTVATSCALCRAGGQEANRPYAALSFEQRGLSHTDTLTDTHTRTRTYIHKDIHTPAHTHTHTHTDTHTHTHTPHARMCTHRHTHSTSLSNQHIRATIFLRGLRHIGLRMERGCEASRHL